MSIGAFFPIRAIVLISEAFLGCYQTWCSRGCYTNSFVLNLLFHQLSQRCISSKSSKYHNTKTVRARKLKFFKRMFISHKVSCVTCHMSRVMCHMSTVTCHRSSVMSHLLPFKKMVEVVGGGFVINGAYPV